ncbi:energy-coupling factor transporter transmembrane component T family protein [Guggenheimella bovis]
MKSKLFKGALSVIAFVSLFYGRTERIHMGVFLVIVMFYILHESHHLRIERIQQNHALIGQKTGLKVLFFAFHMIAVLVIDSLPFLLGVLILEVFFTLLSKIKLKHMIEVMALPMTYVLLSIVAFRLSELSYESVILISLRAFVAFTTLLSFLLMTPMHELITFLSGKLPKLVVDLLYLIHHDIFVFLKHSHEVSRAVRVRGGSLNVKTAALQGVSIFMKSMHFSTLHSRALETRNVGERIEFLTRKKDPRVSLGLLLELMLLSGGIVVSII